jgi:glutathione S-transferase
MNQRGCSVSSTTGLAGRNWVIGADYSIADISLPGRVRNLVGFYEARELVGFDRVLHVQMWLDRGINERTRTGLGAAKALQRVSRQFH